MTAPDKSIDFDLVASYYDLFVRADFDLPFWIEEARQHPGRRLELMCGTGRISLAILEAGLSLDCVDYSAALLECLRGKLDSRGLSAGVFEMDARELSFANLYDWAFIGFHAFAELRTRSDQGQGLRSIHRVLRERGVLSVALHNPAIRGPQLDGKWGEIASTPIPDSDRRLRVRARFFYDTATGQATGEQEYTEVGPADDLAARSVLPVRFCLVDRLTFESLVADAGFAVESLVGSYDRAPFDDDQSPVMIYRLKKR